MNEEFNEPPHPKVLLLVNSDPAGNGVGELFLRDIARLIPSGKLVRVSTVQKPDRATEEQWLGFRSITRYAPASRWPGLSTLAQNEFRTRILGPLTAEIAEIAQQEKVELIWSVLSSPAVILLSNKLMQTMHTPFATTVLDDPEYVMRNLRLGRLSRKRITEEFASVLRASGSVSVVSEKMGECYKSLHGIDSVIIRHGVEDRLAKPWKPPSRDRQEISLVFAGSLYAKQEWNALVRALNVVKWNVAGRQVTLTLVGRVPRFGVNIAPPVRAIGQVSYEDALAQVRKSDIAYLPYWFSKAHRDTVKTSFPGKLSSYAACGIPVFFHGPEDSSVAPFLKKHPFGLCCHSTAPSEIVQTLERLVSSMDFYDRSGAARDYAFATELSLSAMQRTFGSFIQQAVLKPRNSADSRIQFDSARK